MYTKRARICLQLSVILLCIALGIPAQAQRGPKLTCTLRWDIGHILKDWTEQTQKEYGRGAISICTNTDGKVVFATLYSAPQKSGTNICFIRARDLTLVRDAKGNYKEPEDHPGWEYLEPYLKKVPASDPCPAIGDRNKYINSIDVPDGVFLELLRIWGRMRASPSTIDALCDGLSVGDRSLLAWLKSLLTDPKAASHIQLNSISAQLRDFWHTDRTTDFQMVVNDDRDPLEWFVIGFDWTPNGFKIVRVEMMAS